jgi:hypothetical protein
LGVLREQRREYGENHEQSNDRCGQSWELPSRTPGARAALSDTNASVRIGAADPAVLDGGGRD